MSKSPPFRGCFIYSPSFQAFGRRNLSIVFIPFRSQSHKWTVYVRGATSENLGVVIKRVVFQLHPSFNNPTRAVESPPFELSECGWGEFEIAFTLFFHTDVCEQQLDL